MTPRRIIWAVLAVIAVAGIAAAGWVWRDDIADAARQAVIGDELRQELRESEQELQRERERRQQIVDTAERRLEQLNELRDRQAELEQVIENDEESQEWAGRDLPDSIARFVRGGSGDGNADSDGEAAKSVDDMPNGSAAANGDEQRSTQLYNTTPSSTCDVPCADDSNKRMD